jgi:alpha-beta hydrolase superfamily lysophospholipase
MNKSENDFQKSAYWLNKTLVGHSMGGVISRLLVSNADVSEQAIQKMNEAQLNRLE